MLTVFARGCVDDEGCAAALGPIWQVLALASIVTVALTTWGHTGDTILWAVDQVVAFVAITCEVLLQHT